MINFKTDVETPETDDAAIFMALGFQVVSSKIDNPNRVFWGITGEVTLSNGMKINARTARNMLHNGIPLFKEPDFDSRKKCIACYQRLKGILAEIKEEARKNAKRD